MPPPGHDTTDNSNNTAVTSITNQHSDSKTVIQADVNRLYLWCISLPRTGSEMRCSDRHPGGVNSVCPGSHSRYAICVTLQVTYFGHISIIHSVQIKKKQKVTLFLCWVTQVHNNEFKQNVLATVAKKYKFKIYKQNMAVKWMFFAWFYQLHLQKKSQITT